MKFCSACAAPVRLEVPAGDNRPRFVCTVCNQIYYQNPKIVAGCISVWEDQILLCRRAINPRYGLWTLPAGFMENGESVAEAAARETAEEAGAQIDTPELYGIYSIPHVNQVYMMFRAQLRSPLFAPGSESLEAKLYTQDTLPWDALAFRVVHLSLQRFLADWPRQHFPPHHDVIRPLSAG